MQIGNVRHRSIICCLRSIELICSAPPGGQQRKGVFFFRLKLTLPEGEGPASRSKTLAENGQRRAFTPAVIIFIALPEAKDNADPG